MSLVAIRIIACLCVSAVMVTVGLIALSKPPDRVALDRFQEISGLRLGSGGATRRDRGRLLDRLGAWFDGVMGRSILARAWSRRRAGLVVAQLPEALELVVRALQAGLGVDAGFRLIAEEMTGPVAAEFGRVTTELEHGIALEAALDGLDRRVPAPELQFLVAAVLVQKVAGGDLGEVLGKLGTTIRQRIEIRSLLRAKSAEARLSALAIIATAPLLLAYLAWTNWSYVEPLFVEARGRALLRNAALWDLAGICCMHWFIRIRI
jgi:Flp pilus assembly protein TadB